MEIAPGVSAVLTAGHTPGHQSFVVSLDQSVGGGGFVFAFDAADLTGNIEREVAVGGRIGAGPEVSVEQIRKLKRIAADRGYRLVPGHDPVVWPALTRELASRETGQRYASLSVLEGASYLRIAVIGAPDILGAEKTLAADALPRM